LRREKEYGWIIFVDHHFVVDQLIINRRGKKKKIKRRILRVRKRIYRRKKVCRKTIYLPSIQ
jgi:hypothetical protein